MTVAVAREHGLPVDEQIAQQQLKRTASILDSTRDTFLQGFGIPSAASNILVGMAAEHHPPDLATDAVGVRFEEPPIARREVEGILD